MATDPARVESLFDAALHRQTPAEREAYLDGACAADGELREQVESLLLAHDRAGHLLETAPLGLLNGHAAPPHEGPGTRIGRYKLLQLIGEGGFGSVFMAEQEHPVRRKVALKIIKLGMDTKQVIARFEAERQALAMMDHPNIARVLDAGATETGRPYFAMELVRGVPITEYCDDANLSTTDRLELFILVCRAVQHAHQKGIIHRDLKPSNVLVTLHDDKPVPKVIDFGIAKATQSRLTEKTLFTEYRQFIGTPQYMSPEQAQMSGLDVDTRSDVYSLGVLLYELLTGTTPIDAAVLRSAAYDQVRQMIQDAEPPRPSTRLSTMGENLTKVAAHRRTDATRLPKLIRGDLDWVVMTALEKDRTRRYDTANGLAMDVQRYLNNEPVSASPPGQWYAFRKLVRRHKGLVAAVMAVVAALALGLTVATFGMFHAVAAQKKQAAQRLIAEQQRLAADVARADAERSRNDAIKARAEAETALASIYPSNGFRASDLGQYALASLWFANATRLAGPATEMGRLNARRSASWTRMGMIPVAAVTILGEWPLDLRLHADGRYLLAQTLDNQSGGNPTWTLWDVPREAPVALPSDFGAVTAAAWSPDGSWLAVGNAHGEVRLLGFPGLDRVQTIKATGPVHALTFASRGSRVGIAAGTAAAVWDRAAQALVTPWLPHPAAVVAVGFSPAGDRLLTTCADQRARLFPIAKDKADPLFEAMPHVLRPLTELDRPSMPAFIDEGRSVLTVTATAIVWHDARDGRVTHTVDVPDGVHCVTTAGKRVVVAGANQVRVLDEAGKLQRSIEQRGVTCAAFCPDERVVAMGAGPAINLWWNRAAQPRNGGLPTQAAPVSCVSFSPDARFVITAERGGLVRLWALPLVQMVASIPFTGSFSGGRFSRDGKYVMACGSNYTAGDLHATRVYSVSGGDPVGPVMEVGGVIRCGAFSPTATQVALLTGTDDASDLELWDWASGRRTASVRLAAHPESLSYSPDGKNIAVVTSWGESLLIDAAGGGVRRRWVSKTVPARGDLLDATSCFSPDGRTLITFDSDSLIVRDVASGEPRLAPLRCGADWTGACFSPDGQQFATTSRDNELRVWETSTNRQLSSPMNNPSGGAGPRFSADGQLLLTTHGTVSVWDWRAARLMFAPDTQAMTSAWGKDGSIVAARAAALQLLDGRTGAVLQMIEGPQGQLLDVAPGGTIAITTGMEGMFRLLSLTDDPGRGPPADACLVSELAAAQRIAPDGAVVSLTTAEWVERWRRSRAAGPPESSPLSATSGDAIAFHRQKAADAENGDAARAFHLDRLAAAGVATSGERITRARTWASLGKWDKAAEALTEAVDQSGVDPSFLKEYTDLLPILGDSSAAAAALQQLQRSGASHDREIVRGSWWALGPLPIEMLQGKQDAPDADARHVVAAPASADEPGHEVGWRMLDNAPNLDLGTQTKVGHHVQARLYSPDARDVLFGITLDDGGRVWLNGQKVYDLSPGWAKVTTVKVPLRPGWNTILATLVNRDGAHRIQLDISEEPLAWGKFYLDHPEEGSEKGLPYLAQAIALHSTDAESYVIRGESLARLGRFAPAVADYLKALELKPRDEWPWMDAALLRLYTGDLEGYRQTAREFLAQFKDAKDVYSAEHVARVLATDPDPDPLLDTDLLQQVVARVDAALPAATPTNRSFLEMAKGAVRYRMREYGPAMDALQRSRASVGLPEGEAICDLYLAMAQYRLHHNDEATALFNEACAIIDEKLPKPDAGNLSHVYHEWLLCQILRREAAAMLSGAPVAHDWPAARRRRRATDIRLLTVQIQADPAVAWNYHTRALVYARDSQFDQALADWDKAIEIEPGNPTYWYLRGCTLAWLQKTERYQSHRTAMLARFSDGVSHDVAERVAKTALLMPIGAAELKRAAESIDFALSPGGGANSEVWYPLAKALSEYRAGESDPAHYEQAIEWLTRAKRRNHIESYLAAVDFYLAMAHYRLGHAEQAQAAFAAAVKRADARLPRAGGDDLVVSGPVENWLICNVARREAEGLLGVATSQPTTRP